MEKLYIGMTNVVNITCRGPVLEVYEQPVDVGDPLVGDGVEELPVGPLQVVRFHRGEVHEDRCA